jgi:hypothetical protein
MSEIKYFRKCLIKSGVKAPIILLTMHYKTQHNGKGKSHLLSNDLDIICNSKGDFNFMNYRTLIIENGKYFEECETISTN